RAVLVDRGFTAGRSQRLGRAHEKERRRRVLAQDVDGSLERRFRQVRAVERDHNLRYRHHSSSARSRASVLRESNPTARTPDERKPAARATRGARGGGAAPPGGPGGPAASRRSGDSRLGSRAVSSVWIAHHSGKGVAELCGRARVMIAIDLFADVAETLVL